MSNPKRPSLDPPLDPHLKGIAPQSCQTLSQQNSGNLPRLPFVDPTPLHQEFFPSLSTSAFPCVFFPWHLSNRLALRLGERTQHYRGLKNSFQGTNSAPK